MSAGSGFTVHWFSAAVSTAEVKSGKRPPDAIGKFTYSSALGARKGARNASRLDMFRGLVPYVRGPKGALTRVALGSKR